MKFIVKAFDLDGQEMEFERTVIGKEKEVEVAFEHLKAAEAFIEGIKFRLPSTFQYRIIPEEELS